MSSLTLEDLLVPADEAMRSLTGVSPQRSTLITLGPGQWQAFCAREGLVGEAEGVYLPSRAQAVVRTNVPALVSNAFHEYFGHGTFCEQSALGKELVAADASHGDVAGLLYGPHAGSALGFERPSVNDHEGFALWTEKNLCERLDLGGVWRARESSLLPWYRETLERYCGYEQTMGKLGFLAQLGMPKHYANEDVVDAVKKLYGPAFANIDLLVLYGSKKPTSDVDVFIVSSNPSLSKNLGWIDVYELNRERFSERLHTLDVSVTDPLLRGELIHGDAKLFASLREHLATVSCTPAHGSFAVARADLLAHELTSGLYDSVSAPERRAVEGYIASYRTQAPFLAQGVRALSLTDIERYAGGPVRPHKQ